MLKCQQISYLEYFVKIPAYTNWLMTFVSSVTFQITAVLYIQGVLDCNL